MKGTKIWGTGNGRKLKNSSLELGLAVARLGRATPCGPYGARPSASGNLTTSSQAHLPMGRDHPQGADTQLKTPTRNLNQFLIFDRLYSVALMVHFRVASEGGVFVSARSAVFVFGSAAKAVGFRRADAL